MHTQFYGVNTFYFIVQPMQLSTVNFDRKCLSRDKTYVNILDSYIFQKTLLYDGEIYVTN